MAKQKKTNAQQGVLAGIIILCLIVVFSVAIAQGFASGDGSGSDGNQVQSSQTGTNTPTDSLKTESAASPTDRTTDTATGSQTGSAPKPTTDTQTQTTTSDTNKDPYVSKNETASFDKDAWYMFLANPDNPLPEGFTFEQATVYSAGRNWIMDARCAEDMKAMIAAADADGVDLILCSAYRTYETQERNFNNKVQYYLQQGYSEEEAKRVTATIIAVPGTSEHHTGLAADIVTPSYQNLNSGFAKTKAFEWLYNNCATYGFVLRYPEDKQDITKIIYEPWHYRYVGKEAATIMMDEGICFEEFLEQYGTEAEAS